MTRPLVRTVALVLLLAAAAATYLWRIGSAPLYLAPDEVAIANDAYALATSGRTLDGTFLPLYVHVEVSGNWFMPAIYYAMALVLQVAPLAEWSIRVPTVLAGLLTIVLTYVVGRRVLGDWRWALVAALVVAAAPAHFILSRYGLDYTFPNPFILAWLWCLLIASEPGRSRGWWAAAGLCLGLGWYTYIAAMVMMPVYLVMTLAMVAVRTRHWRDALAATAAFVVPLTLFAVWLTQHPEAVIETLKRYNLLSPEQQKAGAGAVDALQSFDIGAMLVRYRYLLSYEFLFQLGDIYLPFSTRSVGVFVPATALLLGLGLGAAAITQRSAVTILILFGFLTAPLAASLLVEEGAMRRATGLLPFAGLLCGFGARQFDRIARIPWFRPAALAVGAVALLVGAGYLGYTLLGQGRVSVTATRVAVAGLGALAMGAMAPWWKHGHLLLIPVLLAMVMQFGGFLRSYHGEYQSRLAPWLQGNIRGALTQMMAEADRRPDAPIVFATLRSGRGDLDLRNRYLPSYWHFYTASAGREDLRPRARFVPQDDDLSATPEGSLILGNLEDPQVARLLGGTAQPLAVIPEIDRDPFFTILLR